MTDTCVSCNRTRAECRAEKRRVVFPCCPRCYHPRRHGPCPNCGSTERTAWLHAKEYPFLGSATAHWPDCFRYCRGCSTVEVQAHGDHRKPEVE